MTTNSELSNRLRTFVNRDRLVKTVTDLVAERSWTGNAVAALDRLDEALARQSMFDRIACAIQRALQTNSVVRVAGNFFSPAVRLVHNRFQFLHRQRRLRYQISLLVHPRAVRHINFQPVRSVIQLFACSLARFDRPVNNLCALRHLQFRRVAFQAVAAGGGDCPRYNKQPRPGNCSFCDRLFDFHVAVARTLGFQIA